MPKPTFTFFATLALTGAAAAQPLAVAYRGMVNLPITTADQSAAAFTIAGLSGIARRTGDEYIAVMDNSDKLVRLSIALNADASIASATVLGGITLALGRDFEGAAFSDGASIFLSEEGTPAVLEFGLSDGALIRTLDTPAVFGSRRDNFGFESLTRRALSGELWTANEEALTVDGAPSTTAAGTTVRILRYAPGSLTPSRQYAYVTQPIHGAVVTGARSGLSDLVALPSGRMIALERSFAFSASGFFQTRIYELDFSAATDVSGLTSLIGQVYTPVAKRLLYQGSLNNLEGLCLGPKLPNGHAALLGIIDDGDPISVNAAVAFELSGSVDCPGDANGDGAITVQDIFDYLALYFASLPGADVNGSGTVTVQDIFDFLAAYFTACG